MPKRKSLRDLDRAAIATPAADELETAIPSEPAPQERREPAAAPKAPRPAERRTSSKVRAGESPVAVYATPALFDQAKAAYVAAWDRPDGPISLGRWVDAAVAAHAALTPLERRTAVETLPPLPDQTGRGVSRQYALTDATLSDATVAITADRRELGRVESRSEFIAEAIRAAAERERITAGGTLPPAPRNLPRGPRPRV